MTRLRIAAGLGLVLSATPVQAQDARESGPLMPAPERLSAEELRADTLDRLFAQLRKASTDEDGRLVEAAIWKLWMTSDSASASVLIAQASKAMSAEERQAAKQILDALIQVHPDFAEAWNKRATLYFMAGRYAESLADIDHVLDLEPRHFGALAGLGMIKQNQGDVTAALKAFREALAINPHMPGVAKAVKELESKERPI